MEYYIYSFFALYIDDIVKSINAQEIGCFIRHVSVSIILYADDILLLTPSVAGLQKLLLLCEAELQLLGLKINDKKTVCMRIGPHYQASCGGIVTLNGRVLEWVHEIRYLGVYLVSSSTFKCSFSNAKKSFYRSFNAIYGRIGRAASEEVILALIKAKCIPVLLYGLDVCPTNATDKRSLDFTVNRILMKLFKTYDINIIRECQRQFAFASMHELIEKRKIRFLVKYIALENNICNLCSTAAELELLDIRTV